MAEYLSLALSSFLSIDVFLGLLVGVVGGMIIGIIPGLGPSVGIALLLPISFSMSPTAALVMMTAMYTTGVYGGSITAVLCHTPGTAASAATTQDGYEMTKKGRGMEAVSVVTIASVVGGIIGAICLILFAPALGRISQMFSCLEYFLVACFGVLVVAGLTGDNQAKGIFAGVGRREQRAGKDSQDLAASGGWGRTFSGTACERRKLRGHCDGGRQSERCKDRGKAEEGQQERQ